MKAGGFQVGEVVGRRGTPGVRRRVLPWICALLCLSSGGQALAGAHLWADRPDNYLLIDPVAVGDRNITYQIDLIGFNLFGGRNLDAAQMRDLTDGVRQAFETWNQVLEPIGLRFVEAQADEPVELSVRALPYDRLRPNGNNDSVAMSLTWPFKHVYTILPIWFDATEQLGNLLHAPVLAGDLLSQPYVRIVASDQYDIYSVALHEMGHVLGLGHVVDALKAGNNYNFLGLSTVLLDSTCLTPSTWVNGLDTAHRRPILETEIPSLMIPIRRGTVTRMIPPEDQATAAFLLRNLNPAGADQVLQQARALYEQTTPLRFANVRYELEKNNGFQRNGTLASAMPVEPNQIIIGSLFGEDSDGSSYDTDYYRLDLTAWPAGTPILLRIQEAGGLIDTGATGIQMQLLDTEGNLVALGQAVGTPGPGNYSSNDPALDWRLARPDIYYIKIQQPEDAVPGTYVLKIGVGAPAEPSSPGTAPIDAVGSEGCPTVTPKASVCPGLGFGVLALAGLALFAACGRRGG
jgi:hypothetical protein